MSQVITQLKQLQADSHALYIKIHNYHWHVKGMDFMPVHEQTEEIYNEMSVLYDDSAERVIQLGATPYIVINDLVNATKIVEETASSFNSKEIITNIIADFQYLLKSFQNLSNLADSENDKTTVGFADELIAKYEKKLWILNSMAK